jgi:hypothetical protein
MHRTAERRARRVDCSKHKISMPVSEAYVKNLTHVSSRSGLIQGEAVVAAGFPNSLLNAEDVGRCMRCSIVLTAGSCGTSSSRKISRVSGLNIRRYEAASATACLPERSVIERTGATGIAPATVRPGPQIRESIGAIATEQLGCAAAAGAQRNPGNPPAETVGLSATYRVDGPRRCSL